ncbi:MAG: BON domain-containing protein, partial [Flavobacterium sp.]
MKTNTDLQQKVQDALRWEPLLAKVDIGVSADNGIVTLTGYVDSYAKKLKAESIVKDIKGVLALVEKIEVKFGVEGAVTDAEIANQVVNAIKWNWEIPNDVIKVQVE